MDKGAPDPNREDGGYADNKTSPVPYCVLFEKFFFFFSLLRVSFDSLLFSLSFVCEGLAKGETVRARLKGPGPSLGNEDAQKFGVNDRLWESRGKKKGGSIGHRASGTSGAGRTALTATGSALAGKLGKASNYGSGVLRTGLGKNTGRMYLAGALRRGLQSSQ